MGVKPTKLTYQQQRQIIGIKCESVMREEVQSGVPFSSHGGEPCQRVPPPRSFRWFGETTLCQALVWTVGNSTKQN